MKVFVLVVLVVAGAQAGLGCDLCSVYSATEAQGGGGKGFFGGVAEQYTHLGSLQQDGQRVANSIGQYMDSSVSQAFAGYNFNERFGLQLNLPVIYRSYRRPYGSVIENGTVSGIGDLSLLGRLVGFEKMRQNFSLNWSMLGGLKLPTGNSSLLGQPEIESEPPLPDSGIGGHDLALGSGSVDGIIGSTFSARWKQVFLNAGLQYAIRTEGSFGHQYANDVTWSGGPGFYFVLSEDYTLSLQAVVSGESKGKDTYYGVPDEDSAETIVYLGPQINLTWSDKLSLQLGGDLPVSIYNSGLQTVPDYRVHLAFTWRF
jgi:hypothetical protein